MTDKMMPHTGIDRRKRTSGIRGLAWKAYVSCVSDFPCRVYINWNHSDFQILVTACLVVVSTSIINGIKVNGGLMEVLLLYYNHMGCNFYLA
jgi:hypothetical protein